MIDRGAFSPEEINELRFLLSEGCESRFKDIIKPTTNLFNPLKDGDQRLYLVDLRVLRDCPFLMRQLRGHLHLGNSQFSVRLKFAFSDEGKSFELLKEKLRGGGTVRICKDPLNFISARELSGLEICRRAQSVRLIACYVNLCVDHLHGVLQSESNGDLLSNNPIIQNVELEILMSIIETIADKTSDEGSLYVKDDQGRLELYECIARAIGEKYRRFRDMYKDVLQQETETDQEKE